MLVRNTTYIAMLLGNIVNTISYTIAQWKFFMTRMYLLYQYGTYLLYNLQEHASKPNTNCEFC